MLRFLQSTLVPATMPIAASLCTLRAICASLYDGGALKNEVLRPSHRDAIQSYCNARILHTLLESI